MTIDSWQAVVTFQALFRSVRITVVRTDGSIRATLDYGDLTTEAELVDDPVTPVLEQFRGPLQLNLEETACLDGCDYQLRWTAGDSEDSMWFANPRAPAALELVEALGVVARELAIRSGQWQLAEQVLSDFPDPLVDAEARRECSLAIRLTNAILQEADARGVAEIVVEDGGADRAAIVWYDGRQDMPLPGVSGRSIVRRLESRCDPSTGRFTAVICGPEVDVDVRVVGDGERAIIRLR